MRTLHLLALVVSAGVLLVYGCTSENPGSVESGSSGANTSANGTASNSTLSAGLAWPDSAGLRLGVPWPLATDQIPQGCPLDPVTTWFVCGPDTDSRGAVIAVRYAYLDASGTAQPAFDEALTESISMRFTLDAHPQREGRAGTIHSEEDLTVSGLAGAEASRIWNGTITETCQGLPTGPGCGGDTTWHRGDQPPSGPGGPPDSCPGGADSTWRRGGPPAGGPGGPPDSCPRGADSTWHRGDQPPGGHPRPPGGGPGGPDSTWRNGCPRRPDGHTNPSALTATVTSTIKDVAMPHPLGEETWPLSGSITRKMRMETVPNGVMERTEVITFNGTRYATLTIGDRTCQIDLKNPRPPMP